MGVVKRNFFSATSVAVMAVLFIAVIILSNTLLRGARLDLTENKLFTVSHGTKNILASIEEPVNLYLFFSERASENFPPLRNYATRVRELLEEFALHAGGKLVLHTVDPLPFSEDEDRAAQFGLQSVPVGTTGDNLFFGLAGTNALDGLKVIPFFQQEKESFLEYDLAQLIHSLINPKKPVVGMLSSLPMSGGFDPATRRPQRPWVVMTQLQDLFDVRTLEADIAIVDDDVDVLVVAHPKDLSDKALYAIDQFVLRGGKLMVFVDPIAEADISGIDPANPASAMMADRSSNLSPLFDAWGVEFDPGKVVADRRYALSVSVARNGAPVPHVGILGLSGAALNDADVVTAELNTINVAAAGALSAKEGNDLTFEPLVSSSEDSMLMDAARFRGPGTDPKQFLRDFAPTGESYTLAARLRGKLKTAFTDGAPKQEKAEDGDTDEAKQNEDSDRPVAHRAESDGPVDIIVFGDTDVLTDRLWVRVSNFFGQTISSAWANNGDLITNALDNLTGSSDLIGIRGRASFSRPFETVEVLKREADDRFRKKEEELQLELRETEQKLTELQSQRTDDTSLILTPEQRAELGRFQEQKLRVRKQLRQVRRELDKNIEELGTTLKVINIGLVPLLVALFALGLAWVRARRRAVSV